MSADDLRPAIRAAGLLGGGDPDDAGSRLLVMFSGGRDSTCLLDVAIAAVGAGRVRALHVNHGLRLDADADEAHCASTCAELGVVLHVHRCPPPPPTGNRQAWARGERYGAARALAGGAAIAVGHTATDQVETILYRLASSPSRRALLGMPPRDDSDPAAPLLRPLLSVTRDQTAAHCRARGLAWRDDATNAGDAYARSRVRHELVPALERVHPAASANVLALAERLADEAAVLDELVDAALGGPGAREIAVEALRAQPPALRRLVVQRLADAAAGEPAAGVARRAEEVAALPARGSASLDLPHGVRATARGGVISFAATPPLRRRPGRP